MGRLRRCPVQNGVARQSTRSPTRGWRCSTTSAGVWLNRPTCGAGAWLTRCPRAGSDEGWLMRLLYRAGSTMAVRWNTSRSAGPNLASPAQTTTRHTTRSPPTPRTGPDPRRSATRHRGGHQRHPLARLERSRRPAAARAGSRVHRRCTAASSRSPPRRPPARPARLKPSPRHGNARQPQRCAGVTPATFAPSQASRSGPYIDAGRQKARHHGGSADRRFVLPSEVDHESKPRPASVVRGAGHPAAGVLRRRRDACGGLGTTVINPSATTVTALVVEALVAFLWVLAYYALFVDERGSKAVAGLGVGLAYGTAILALAPITGASGNFARTFGAELSAKLGGGPAHWGDLWIYAVGPIVGGIVAVVVYDVLIAGPPLMAPMARGARTGRPGAARPTPA